jgi:hypothetical protein
MKIAKKIINEMSRGILVTDENLKALVPFLERRNIRVLTPKQGESDQFIKQVYLSKRIFVTNNSKDFVKDASSYEYGVISTENIKSKDPELLAKMISDALTDFSLWSKKHGFILKLKDNSKHEYKDLVK